MKDLTSLLTLSLLLAHVSPACGDWFYDFDDGVIPDTFVTESFGDWSGTPSDTLHVSADGGVLGMWDPVSPNAGGSVMATGFDREVFDGNVRVSAEINSTGMTNEGIGLFARGGELSENKSAYYSYINFDPNAWDSRRLYVVKGLPNGTVEIVTSWWEIPAMNQSYFMELEVTDDPITGFPEVSTRLFDHQGGTLLMAISFTDANFGGFPPATPGTAGVWTGIFDDRNDTLDASFDSIRAVVPEPPLLGDMNLDGVVNGLDVDPFVAAVIGGNTHPASPFVAAVIGSDTQQIPEPSALLLCVVALAVVGAWQKWSG